MNRSISLIETETFIFIKRVKRLICLFLYIKINVYIFIKWKFKAEVNALFVHSVENEINYEKERF